MRCFRYGVEDRGRARFCLDHGHRLAGRCLRCGAESPSQDSSCFIGVGPVAQTAPTDARPDALGEWAQRTIPKAFVERGLTSHGTVGADVHPFTVLFSDLKGLPFWSRQRFSERSR